jgi:DHA2 family multidrug resistance protein-like MFS transporter
MTDVDGLPVPRRYWAIGGISLGITLAVIDSAIANVALPTIASDLNAEPAHSIWVVNGYQLAITVALLPLSSLGDRIGYRNIYVPGLAIFTLASLACAMATSLELLTLARVVQGIGAAGIMSVSPALLRQIYPQSLLGRGLGINALVVALAAAAGPTIASAILAFAPWPWLFAVNIPIGIAAFALAAPSLPRTQNTSQKFDIISALLSAAAFGLLIGSIDALGQGENFGLFVAELALGGILAWILTRREIGQPSPVLPVDLLRIPIFALSIATSIASFMAQMLALVSLPFMLHGLGFDAVTTGLLITPWPIAIAIAAPLAGHFSDRYPAGLLGGIGLGIFAIGLLSLALLPANATVFDIGWRMAVCGAGFGTFQSPNNRAMMNAAPKARSGGAGGMLATARLLGQTTGAAVVAMMFIHVPGHGAMVSLFIAAGAAVVAAFVSLARLYELPTAQATRASNPEADPTMRADILKQQAQDYPKEP